MSLDAKMVTITSIAYKIRGVGKGTWWRNQVEQGAGVRSAFTKWETTVRKIKWGAGIPEEAWVGLSQELWRLEADPDLETILLMCQSELACL